MGKKGKSRAQGGEGARRRREEMPCQAETDAKGPVSEAETGLMKCLIRLYHLSMAAQRVMICSARLKPVSHTLFCWLPS